MMLSDLTLGGVTARARRFGNKPAIICGDRQLSFVELDDRVATMAAALAGAGIGAGSVVSIYGPVGWEWVVAYHAALRLCAVVNPVNALLTPDEVGFILEDCQATMILADRARLDALDKAEAIPDGVQTVAFEAVERLSATGSGVAAPDGGNPEALSTICYTSGTTGRPKGAMLSHRNVLMNAGLTALMHGRSIRDVIVSGLPLAHVYGNVVMNSALIVGATLVLLPAFSAEAAFAAIGTHRATRFDGVPTMYYRLLDDPGIGNTDLASLEFCTVGGQTMPIEKMAAVEAALDCPLIELWGMSEIGGLGTTFPWTGPRTLGSIGVALPGMKLRTVDPVTGVQTGTDIPGELHIRGPLIMQGYRGNAAATREVLDEDGWLATGDIARIDAHGQIYVVDRMKDLILTSGNNVYPAEIERAIASLAGVAMVGVGREPHPDKGEVPHAYIVLETGAALSPDTVIAHCRTLLAPYKLPRGITFVDDLPKTSSGKIMRRKLGAG